jgi:hypothetical protein
MAKEALKTLDNNTEYKYPHESSAMYKYSHMTALWFIIRIHGEIYIGG